MSQQVLNAQTRRRLILSILRFLQIEANDCSPDRRESIEVAMQCLQSAYDMGQGDETDFSDAEDLASLFVSSEQQSAENLNRAEEYKTRGNEFMRSGKPDVAVDMYTRAVDLNPNNAVYFCNRAAAHSRLGNHQAAVEDCLKAVKLDPSYSKAYGRLGVAYSNLNMYKEARDAYNTARQLDPNNTTYEENLRIAEEQILTGPSGSQPVAASPRVDINQFIRNPELINLATQMLNDPGVRNVMTGLLNIGNEGGTPNIDTLMQMGQQLADQMQLNNPTFIDGLRRQFERQQQPPPAQGDNQEQNPDDSTEPNNDNQDVNQPDKGTGN